jgi:predicted ribosome quality control (RQC) complex YloA/Tae2 family protein
MADRSPYPSEQADKFIVRLPDGMRDRIATAAKSNNRTMNAEIVARLEESFEVMSEAKQVLAYLRDKDKEHAALIEKVKKSNEEADAAEKKYEEAVEYAKRQYEAARDEFKRKTAALQTDKNPETTYYGGPLILPSPYDVTIKPRPK